MMQVDEENEGTHLFLQWIVGEWTADNTYKTTFYLSVQEVIPWISEK